jgi:hypothetical protein
LFANKITGRNPSGISKLTDLILLDLEENHLHADRGPSCSHRFANQQQPLHWIHTKLAVRTFVSRQVLTQRQLDLSIMLLQKKHLPLPPSFHVKENLLFDINDSTGTIPNNFSQFINYKAKTRYSG